MLTKLGKIIFIEVFQLKRTRATIRWDIIGAENTLQLGSIFNATYRPALYSPTIGGLPILYQELDVRLSDYDGDHGSGSRSFISQPNL